MTAQSRIIFAVVWIGSLVAVKEWPADAQVSHPGTEVRFVQSNG